MRLEKSERKEHKEEKLATERERERERERVKITPRERESYLL